MPSEAEHLKVLKQAWGAADRVLKGRLVSGMDAWDFATDAWIYNEERGVSHEYTPRRAAFLVVDELRRVLGRRVKKKRARVYSNREFQNIGKAVQKEIKNFPDINNQGDELFAAMCEGVMSGMNKQQVAKWLGVSPAWVSIIMLRHYQAFQHLVRKKHISHRTAKAIKTAAKQRKNNGRSKKTGK